MTYKLDFSGVKDFDAIAPGLYDATVFEVEHTFAQSSGNPMFNFTFAIQGGEYDGRKVFTNAVLTPEAMWKLKQILKACGIDIPENGQIEFEPRDIMGTKVKIQVRHREYQGVKRAEVSAVHPWEEAKEAPKGPLTKKGGLFNKKKGKKGEDNDES